MNGKYEYYPNHKTKCRGPFNIYQARSGGIILLMGIKFIYLNKNQVEELNINAYELEDFDHNAYLNYYNEELKCIQ